MGLEGGEASAKLLVSGTFAHRKDGNISNTSRRLRAEFDEDYDEHNRPIADEQPKSHCDGGGVLVRLPAAKHYHERIIS